MSFIVRAEELYFETAMLQNDNILFLLNSSPNIWRAMDEFHCQLCKALVQRGSHPVIVLSNPVPDGIRKRFESSGAKIHILTYRNRVKFFTGLRKLIRDFSITTLHIRFFSHTQLVPWIVRIHGVRRIIYTEANVGDSKAKGWKKWLRTLRARIATLPIVRIIAISEFVKKQLIEFGIPERKITIVYNGVELKRFTPDINGRRCLAKKYAIEDDEWVLTTISRLTPIKRVDVLLRACELIRCQGFKVRFMIAGQGGPLENELKRLSADLGIGDNVVWIGQTSETEVLLRGTDIFLLSTTFESFGNVLVEAMACGTPVVGSRSGAIPEIVLDGHCGLLADPESSESFAEKIIELIVDQDLHQKCAAGAIQQAANFSVQRAVENTLLVYDAI